MRAPLQHADPIDLRYMKRNIRGSRPSIARPRFMTEVTDGKPLLVGGELVLYLRDGIISLSWVF